MWLGKTPNLELQASWTFALVSKKKKKKKKKTNIFCFKPRWLNVKRYLSLVVSAESFSKAFCSAYFFALWK